MENNFSLEISKIKNILMKHGLTEEESVEIMKKAINNIFSKK